MRNIHVRYHLEDANWWAESDDLPGWYAAGGSFGEVESLAREAVVEFGGADARAVRLEICLDPDGPTVSLRDVPENADVRTYNGGIIMVVRAHTTVPQAQRTVQDRGAREVEYSGFHRQFFATAG